MTAGCYPCGGRQFFSSGADLIVCTGSHVNCWALTGTGTAGALYLQAALEASLHTSTVLQITNTACIKPSLVFLALAWDTYWIHTGCFNIFNQWLGGALAPEGTWLLWAQVLRPRCQYYLDSGLSERIHLNSSVLGCGLTESVKLPPVVDGFVTCTPPMPPEACGDRLSIYLSIYLKSMNSKQLDS